jgi:TetR/AcrR family transcriptional regulator, mexJK operon transcriptional repressor
MVAAEAERFPDVASDYVRRSWDRNVRLLADALSALNGRGLLRIDDPRLAAEQFTWLVVAAPLNRLSLGGPRPYPASQLQSIAAEAVATFLSRFGPTGCPRS